MSQPFAKTPPAYNSSVLCPCDPIPLLVVLFSIAGTGHLRKFCRCGKTYVEFAESANGSFVWPLLQESLGAFTSKRGEFYRENTKKLQESLAIMS